VQFYLGRALQIAGLVGVGVVLIVNLRPEGLTMWTLLQLTAFSVLLFALGTILLRLQR
jgi:hypothetical protein